nr:MAG TPA: hypothetical protein [Microviridae sp.]
MFHVEWLILLFLSTLQRYVFFLILQIFCYFMTFFNVSIARATNTGF